MEPYPLKFLKNLNRGREVITVLINYGFGDLLERLGLLKYLKWGRRMISRKKHEEFEEFTSAQRIRLALQELGPSFVKFGQILSTRPDLIPSEIIEELCLLQENVPVFASEKVHETIQNEFKKPALEVFASFEDEPLAAGSLGQVHLARNENGQQLAVKIRRPGVVQEVERDVALMLEIAQLIERHIPEYRIFDPVGLVNHFTRTIRREMSFQREARAMQEFSRLFEDDPRLCVPNVDEGRSTDAVLTMEFMEGLHIDDLEAIQKSALNPKTIARQGAQIFLKQAFEYGMFHGDPHPGNIRVKRDGSIVLLDYGMIGFLEEEKRELLVDLFLSIARHDVDSTIRTILALGQPTQSVDRPALRADTRDFIDAYYGVDLGKLNIRQLLNDFVSILSNHGLRCPGDMMLLIRAIITLEGIGRQLDPKFNLAEVIAPAIEKLVRRRYDPKRIAEKAISDIKQLFRTAHDLPLHLGRTLQKASQDELKVQFEHKGLDRLIHEFDRCSNRIVVGLVVSSLLVSTALIIRTTMTESLFIAIPLFMMSGFLGLWLVWGILRSGRL
ncbi:ABC1 kinase family protein [Thalassoglobus polymorphus]|uniref:ABC1 atypical kinase-like domain-containing protein n=1 Tax=Thalassoglobus polymorphus TaxID=2527994 RepID=A0A517QKB2_9PLAN|nr:AarF/UbiB family protein [Thalassoglobus polymorphus]QDT32079.1 putative protein kinase UbiB [Thalassoglobus polymorphus]